MRIFLSGIFILLFSQTLFGQSFVFPNEPDWQTLREGDTLQFDLKISGSSSHWDMRLYSDKKLDMSLDSLGHFLWIPPYDLVDRVNEFQDLSVIFEATNSSGNKIRDEVGFTVFHVNRSPLIDELPVFYVKQNNNNEVNLNKLNQITDPDGDPIVFKPILAQMPEGANLSEMGLFSWKPSRNQFRELMKKSLKVKFTVQDQPYKSEATGTLVIQPTQMDLPPEIILVPNDSIINIKEDEFLNLNLYLSDPNGDDNIKDVGYVCNNSRVPESLLQRNTATQLEFKWLPGYDFIDLENSVENVEFIFYVLDESGKRTEKKLLVKVKDTEDIDKLDKRRFSKYQGILIETMDLIAQLDNNQKELSKSLRKARKGKTNRSVVNASLGAVTGVSPVFWEGQTKDYVAGVGGTAVMTMGTLEATDVVGRSKDDILDKMKVNIDLRNQLQSEGDQFARKYSLRNRRRDKDFFVDIDKLKQQLNNKKLIILELDPNWTNPTKPSDANIKKAFPDYLPEDF